MKKRIFIVNIILLALFLTSCGFFTGVNSTNPVSIQIKAVKEELGLSDIKEYASYNKVLKKVLNKKDDIVIFSPESFKIAMDLYSNVLTEKDKNSVQSSLGSIDYLSYESSDTFQIANRLWVNSKKDFYPEYIMDERVKDFVYLIDMSDSEAATCEKNEFVNDATHGFISSTPSVLNDLVDFDVMNILYFKDTWDRGEKIVDKEKSVFHNSDGSDGSAIMFHDHGNTYFYNNKAHMCEMKYNNGFSFMVILPDEGHSIEDVNIDSFIHKEVEYSNDGWEMIIPEFEAENAYDLGNLKGEVDSSIMPLQGGNINLSQVAKIKVDHTGTEAGAVTEAINITSALVVNKNEPFEFICNRPFLFCLMDTLNDDVAFIGVVRAFH